MPNSIYDDWGLDFSSTEVRDLISRYDDNENSISIRQGNYGTGNHQPEPIPYDTRVIIDGRTFRPKTQYYLSIDDDREMRSQIDKLKAIIDDTGWKVYSYHDMEYDVSSKSLLFSICIDEALGKGLELSWSTTVIYNMNHLFNLYKYYRIVNNIYKYFSQYHPNWSLDSDGVYNNILTIKDNAKSEIMHLKFESYNSDNYKEMKMHIYLKSVRIGEAPFSTIRFISTGSRNLEDLSDFLKYFDGLILEVLNYGKVNS